MRSRHAKKWRMCSHEKKSHINRMCITDRHDALYWALRDRRNIRSRLGGEIYKRNSRSIRYAVIRCRQVTKLHIQKYRSWYESGNYAFRDCLWIAELS